MYKAIADTATGKREIIIHIIGDVWKDSKSYHGLVWKVKTKHGIESFKTKKRATEYRDQYLILYAKVQGN